MVKVTSYRKMISSDYLRGETVSPPHNDVGFLARCIKLAIKHQLESRLADNLRWREFVPVKDEIIKTDIVDNLENSPLLKEALTYIESDPMFVFVRDWRMSSRKCVLFKVRWDPEIARFRYV